ncbi:MAG: hypothetical protein EXR66_02990 [Dehalococcoidia bacterium]|nr:hypothetical protein [Dehalococcoidia bacterium]
MTPRADHLLGESWLPAVTKCRGSALQFRRTPNEGSTQRCARKDTELPTTKKAPAKAAAKTAAKKAPAKAAAKTAAKKAPAKAAAKPASKK